MKPRKMRINPPYWSIGTTKTTAVILTFIGSPIYVYHTNDLDICAAPQPKSLYIYKSCGELSLFVQCGTCMFELSQSFNFKNKKIINKNYIRMVTQFLFYVCVSESLDQSHLHTFCVTHFFFQEPGVYRRLIFKIRPNILIGLQKLRLRPKDQSRLFIY